MTKSKRRKCVCGINYVPKGRNYCFTCESARDPLPPPSFRDIENATGGNKPRNSQVVFAFKNRVSKRKKDAILEEIHSWKEARFVKPVFDKTDTNASGVELYVVYVKISTQVDSTISKLRSLAEIKYAHLPSPRRPK